MRIYTDNFGKFIVIKESEYKDKVLGLTTNKMLIVVNFDNKRIDEYVCPKKIWELYSNEIHEAVTTPDYQVCKYFGKQEIVTDEELQDKGLFLSMKKNYSIFLLTLVKSRSSLYSRTTQVRVPNGNTKVII